jgi:nucleoid-associated protein YgaU
MEDSTKCPVCGREGIPDYHQGEVRCPSCGSNLEVFRLLDAVEAENNAKSSKWKPIAIASMVLALLFAILYLSKGNSEGADADELAQLRDSITMLKEVIQQPVEEQVSEKKEETAQKAKEEESSESSASEDKDDDEVSAPSDMVTVKDGKKYYTVKSGDTWSRISKKLYGGKVKADELKRLNGTKSDKLAIDQEVIVK